MTDPQNSGPPPRPLPRPLVVGPSAAPIYRPPAPAYQPRAPVAPQPPRKVNRTLVLTIMLSTSVLATMVMCGGVAVLSFAIRKKQAQAVANDAEHQRGVEQMLQGTRMSSALPRPGNTSRRRGMSRPTSVLPEQSPTEEELDARLPPFERHLKWLESSNGNHVRDATRWFAGQPLDTQRQSEVIEALRPLLGRTFNVDRASLLDAVTVWGDDSLVPELEHFAKLHERDAANALTIIAEYETPAAGQVLVSFLEMRDELAGAAKKVLLEHPEFAKEALIPQVHAQDKRTRDAARDLLKKLDVSDDDLFAQSLQDLENADWYQRVAVLEWFAKAQLSEENRAKVVVALSTALASDSRSEREAALTALANDPSDASTKVLLQALDGPSDIWPDALKVLLDRGDKRLVPKLEIMLKDPARRGRAMIVSKQAKQPEAIFRELLATTDDREVMQAVVMFQRDGFSKDSLPALERVEKLATEQKDTFLAAMAKRAIESTMKK